VTPIVVAAVVGLGLAAGLGAVILARDGAERAPSTAARGPATPREPRAIPVGGLPVAIAARSRGVWALVGRPPAEPRGLVEAARTRLAAISPSGSVRRGPVLQLGGEDLVATGGSLYAAFDRPSRVLRVDGRTLRRVAASERFVGLTRRLAVGAGAVWVTERSRTPPAPDHLLKLDPETLATIARIPIPHGASDVRVGGGSVWVADRDSPAVSRIDPAADRVVDRVTAGDDPAQLAFGAHAVWSANADGTVTRVDARTRVPIVLAAGARPSAIEFRGGEVWVASLATNSVTRIDARRTRADEPIPTCLNPAGLTITRDEVWVACVGDRSIVRIRRPG
jgi:YVTN family beta-propeller protein